MQTKAEILDLLKAEFERWDQLLSGLSEEQTRAILYGNRTIKDEVAHLWTWQRVSIARIKAAIEGTEPDLSWWPEQFEPENEDDLHDINEWIYESNKDTDWPTVYQNWRSNFQNVIKLSSTLPEAGLMPENKYAWLNGYPLIAVLDGTYDHHHVEHLPGFLDFLREKGW